MIINGHGLTYELKCYHLDGTLGWKAAATNTLTAVALRLMLGGFFRNDALPEAFYLGLSDTSINEGIQILEPSFNYSRVRVPRGPEFWGEIELEAPFALTKGRECQFNNSHQVNKWDRRVGALFLSTEPTGGELLSWAPLRETARNGSREVFPGDTIVVKAVVSLRSDL